MLGSRIEAYRVVNKIRDEFSVGRAIDMESFRVLASKLRGLGWKEAAIRDGLVFGGRRQKEAEVLARVVLENE